MAYITAANTPDTLTGTREADTIIGSSGGDTIQMVFNSGIVFPNLVIDIADGGAGNDTISGGSFRDIVHGGDGDDLLRASDGPLLFGDAGDDHLISGEFESMDYLDGGAGNDVLDSGGPSTSLFYQSATGGIRVDLDERGPQTIGGGEGVDTIPELIYYAVGSQYDDVILGSRVGGAILGGPAMTGSRCGSARHFTARPATTPWSAQTARTPSISPRAAAPMSRTSPACPPPQAGWSSTCT